MIAFCSSPRFVEHDTGPRHPERPDRIRAVYRALWQAGLIAANPFPDFGLDSGIKPVGLPRLLELAPEPADEKWLLLCHPPEHVQRIKRVCAAGGGVLDQGDTPVGANAHEIAVLALGSALRACDAVCGGEARRAFSAARPPGHHAETDRAMGFCLYSNVAIAARYLQQRHGLKRIGIVDFDVHHGNGTQACVEDDPSIYFISLHQHPYTCYPGSGHAWEIGVRAGRGFTLNIPLDPGGSDEEYLAAIDEKVVPALQGFRPDALLLSAGFDAHQADPLAQMEVTDDGFEQITRRLVTFADASCGGRVISVLEGGYDLRALGRSVVRHLVGMQ